MRRLLRVLVLVFAGAGALTGCVESFDPFNLVQKPRVLAIKAEPPSVAPGGRTEVSALLAGIDGAEVSHRWSWCPLAAGSTTGFDCVVSQESLEALAGAAGFTLEDLGLPPLDLGTSPTAVFETTATSGAALQTICRALTSEDIPSFVPVPDCDRGLDATVSLEVDVDGQRVRAVKKLELLFGAEAVPNQNPSLEGVGLELKGGEAVPDTLVVGESYDLLLWVDEGQAELVEPKEEGDAAEREILFVTWYVTAGETEFRRTSFIDGEVPISTLRENSWKIGRFDEVGDEAELFVVLQDGRGGVDWKSFSFAVAGR